MKRVFQHFLHYDLIPLLSMLAVCAFPCVFLYARNASEVPANSMIPFLVVFSLNALLFFGLSAIFLRNVSRAAFFSDLAMLVVINFCLLAVHLKRVLPFLRDRYLLALFILLLLGLFLLLIRKKPDLRTGCLLMLIAFGSMIFINTIQAIPAILSSHEVNREMMRGVPDDENPNVQVEQNVQFGNNRPNVYYFLFDEYGGYDNLEHYYDFDNSAFLEDLEARGFSVSLHSHNTEAVATDTIVPNLLNMNYVVKVEESGHKKAQYRRSCLLYQMFADNGYQINLINHVDYLGTGGCHVLTSNQTRRTISEYLMRNSLYNKFPAFRRLLDQFFVADYGDNYRASLDNALEAELNCWQEAQDGPTLTVGYVQCPHSPTMVGPNGEDLPFSTGWNWRDHSLYLGQVEFINKHILKLVDTIQEHDPDALIFLQSDHGNRYAIHMVQLGEWTDYDPHEENQYMQNILNCVYYKGHSFDIEGETGINTMRKVFSQVLGANLPPITPVQDYSNNYVDEQS